MVLMVMFPKSCGFKKITIFQIRQNFHTVNLGNIFIPEVWSNFILRNLWSSLSKSKPCDFHTSRNLSLCNSMSSLSVLGGTGWRISLHGTTGWLLGGWFPNPFGSKKWSSNWIMNPEGPRGENKKIFETTYGSWVYFGRNRAPEKNWWIFGAPAESVIPGVCFEKGGLAGRLWCPIFLGRYVWKNAFFEVMVDSLVLGFNQLTNIFPTTQIRMNITWPGYFTGQTLQRPTCETGKECRMW